jgi:hypothetical protein
MQTGNRLPRSSCLLLLHCKYFQVNVSITMITMTQRMKGDEPRQKQIPTVSVLVTLI